MPTNLASKAMAPRIRSTSAASVCSASGSANGVVPRGIVEPGLQDELCGYAIAHGLPIARRDARRRERAFRARGRVPLIHARHRQSEPAFQLAGETFGARGHLVRRPV